jgi:hypothetical protein
VAFDETPQGVRQKPCRKLTGESQRLVEEECDARRGQLLVQENGFLGHGQWEPVSTLLSGDDRWCGLTPLPAAKLSQQQGTPVAAQTIE